MSVFIKAVGKTFTKPTAKLYRDAAINAGTLCCYDALNPVSWPQQAAPASGSPSTDKWVNLVDGVADGLFTTGGEIGFDGGFVLSDGPSDQITLRNGAVPAAPSRILGIAWVKHGTQTVGSGNMPIANFFNWVEIMYAASATTNVAANRFYLFGTGTANRELPIGAPVVGDWYQLAAAFDSDTLTLKGFVNGVEVLSAAGYAALTTSTAPLKIGYQAGYTNAYVGINSRVICDLLTAGLTPAQIVARDYALNSGRLL